MNLICSLYQEISSINNSESLTLTERYPKLRSVLEKACRDLTENSPVTFTDLYSRQIYLANQFELSWNQGYWLNGLRITANDILHKGLKPNKENYKYHLKALIEVLATFYNTRPEVELKELISDPYPERKVVAKTKENYVFEIRCIVQQVGKDILICKRDDDQDDEIQVLVKDLNQQSLFADTIARIEVGMTLLLWQVNVVAAGYSPEAIVVEPDFLFNASSVAECFKSYGSSHLNYLLAKFLPKENSKSILLGHLANLFVDYLINHRNTNATFSDILKVGFKQHAIEFAANKELEDMESFKQFQAEARYHFNNIKRIIENDFLKNADSPIEPSKCVLEPSFMSNRFGLQGRLDIMQLNTSTTKNNIVELKSGKPPDVPGKICENHKNQLLIYELLLQACLELKPNNIVARILYSKPERDNLRYEQSTLGNKKQLLNFRNLIAITEYGLSNDATPTQSDCAKFIEALKESNIITKKISDNFLPYAKKDLDTFLKAYSKANKVEKAYFNAYTNFISRELYLSQCGDGKDENSSYGFSGIWRLGIDEKLEKGEILCDLSLVHEKNKANTPEKSISFSRTNSRNKEVNFRRGDIIILYEKKNGRSNSGYSAVNGRIFKGSINEIKKESVTIQLGYQQQDLSPFRNDLWIVEKDCMDSSFVKMYKCLFEFLTTSQQRRDLLFGLIPPAMETIGENEIDGLTDEQSRVVKKAVAAKDYFLLVGPPGTGKTSIIIRQLVKELVQQGLNVLLLAYTNRAVDEICDATDNALFERGEQLNFIRVGASISTDSKYQKNLLEKVVSQFNTRKEIKEVIEKQQVFTSTLSSIQGKQELLKLKEFDVVIVDEASQILEPQIIGLLARAKKFILIGDQKQLPAIVLQDENKARLDKHHILHKIGLSTRSNSLFERLFDKAKSEKWIWAFDELSYQGRMHDELMEFPKNEFYEGKLFLSENLTKRARQIAPMSFAVSDNADSLTQLIAVKRLLFIPTVKASDAELNLKVNNEEAEMVRVCVEKIIELYKANNLLFDVKETIGVITPYRNQISAIKAAFEESEIINKVKDFEDIMVDTVERFQGSDREIVIVSFTASNVSQLKFLTGNVWENGTEGSTIKVDRKLNVALTRARSQLILVGNANVLSANSTYAKLLSHVKKVKGFIAEGNQGILTNAPLTTSSITEEVDEEILF